MNYHYVAVEGNIGAGKTSLCMRLAKDLNAKLLLEQFEDNSFLPRFYSDPARYAFPLEMSFLATRFTQLKLQLAGHDLFQDHIVSDYLFYKCLIFSKITLQDDEFAIYRHIFDIINSQLPAPDLLLYLYRPADQLLANIKKRGRAYEQDIKVEYLEQLQHEYMEFLRTQTGIRTLLLDASGRDFLDTDRDYEKIREMLQEDYAPGVHTLSL